MKKAIPTGVVNYREIRTEGFYCVDKTLLIREFLARKSKVTLITRPRRFGKTINMSMLAEFFDHTQNSEDIFKDTKIMNTEYAKERNQYPTIFISFADCKGDFNSVKIGVFHLLRLEVAKHLRLLDHENVDNDLKDRYQEMYKMVCKRESWADIQFVLVTVCELLNTVYSKPVMLFIDEYDMPFIEAHVKGYYDEFHFAMAGLLSRALKTNPYLKYAMLTGIQRIAKENIFSGLNNLKVFTVRDTEYADFFGFTKEETKELLNYYDLEYNEEVKEMYDGYKMGDVDIYNPWSIVNYADEKDLRPYWVNTSSNEMIKNAMEQSEVSFKEGFEKLIKEGYLDTQVNMQTSFFEQNNTESLWGLFVNAGYLTIEKSIDSINQEYRIRIPNNEVVNEFKALTAYYLHVDAQDLWNISNAMRKNDSELFLKTYKKILLADISYNDLTSENSYQMLLLGMSIYLKPFYKIISNREQGKGRCDIILQSKKSLFPSYVIEMKYMKTKDLKKNPERLKDIALEAINQIVREKYDFELTGDVIYIGLAHAGKEVRMIWKKRS